jgi:hypothetical protein
VKKKSKKRVIWMIHQNLQKKKKRVTVLKKSILAGLHDIKVT